MVVFLVGIAVIGYRNTQMIFRSISVWNWPKKLHFHQVGIHHFASGVEAVAPVLSGSVVGLRPPRQTVYALPLNLVPGPWLGLPTTRLVTLTAGPLAARYGPLVRLSGRPLLLLASHPPHIQTLLSASAPGRSALPTLDAKRRATLPVHMPEYETDFSDLANKYDKELDFKADHFNSLIEDYSDKLIDRMYRNRNLQYEVPSFNDELHKWSLQCTFGYLFLKDSGFLEDITVFNEHDIRISEAVQIFTTLKKATRCLVEAESALFGGLFKRRPFECNIDILHGILCRHLRMNYLSLSRNPPSKLGLVEKMILQDKMSANDILNRLLETVVLGVNIVAHSIGFLIYFLSKNPGCQGKLFDEVSTLHLANLQELPYLNCCIAESMRLCPPFPFLTRELDDDVIVHGYGIPRGTTVCLINEIANRREELFPRPQEFHPERWELRSGRPLSYNYHLLPMAESGALLHSQISILAAKLTKTFKFEYHYGAIRSGGRALAMPDHPFRFTFMDRTP